MLKLRPLDDRIVVEPIKPETETPGGILLPDVAQEKQQKGVVIALGPGKLRGDGERWGMEDVNVGDTVLFDRYTGADVEIEGRAFKVMGVGGILAKVVEGEEVARTLQLRGRRATPKAGRGESAQEGDS
jgi:chaperonin GroES